MNNTHTTSYLTRACAVLALAVCGLTGCTTVVKEPPQTVSTTETTETTSVRHPSMGASTTETRTIQQQ